LPNDPTSDYLISVDLPVMEHFYTIQGEGFHQGKAAYFIRLAGCDVGCVWCDVKESWEAGKHNILSTDYLQNEVRKFSSSIVVITGGEPLIHDLTKLTKSLHESGKKNHIETSGAYPLSGEWDWICVSPKKFKAPLDEVVKKANELKVIIFNKTDFKWAEKYQKTVLKDCQLFLQPEWSREKEMLPAIIDYVKTHPEWMISLQIHKYLQVP
jgi:7-carboxy-7-deazaguanine synthase